MEKTLLTCKWALQIALALLDSPRRPSELLRDISGISERVLYERLGALFDAGFLGKTSEVGYPLVTYYYVRDREGFLELANLLKNTEIDVESLVSTFACKWTLPIMEQLREALSPAELKDRISGISEKVLHVRLSHLESMGFVERRVLPSKPVRVLYSLTKRGRAVLPSLKRASTVILYRLRKRSRSP
ncbi:MAG: winged helix-turn-helix transcriptional regulator [Candidatus Methanosuratincola sp.]|jgi:DNA-binding HxlR family transcriptional regulator